MLGIEKPIVIGTSFGGFVALYGVDESIKLIEDGVAGTLAG